MSPCAPTISTTFFFILSIAYLTLALFVQLAIADDVQGQTPLNILRHTVALSSLPTQFGKSGSLLLSRSVVAPKNIWNAIDPTTAKVLSDPARLDWYVADLSTDGRGTITINAGFSCLDLGRSNSVPLTWWASENLTRLIKIYDGPGGAFLGTAGDGSINDITARCLDGRRFDPNLRLVEHHDQHRNTFVSFTAPQFTPQPVVNNDNIFEELIKLRLDHDRSDEVVFHPSGLPVVLGLTFETGMKVRVPDGFTTTKTNKLKVPMTPLAAVSKHSGFRLEEARVTHAESRTEAIILLLTVWSSGLTLLLAVFIVAKHISDTLTARSEELRRLPVREAVKGTGGWRGPEKAKLAIAIASVTILGAPLALSTAEGQIDPRISVEVTTGAAVLYGTSESVLSDDVSNLFSGAPFQVTVWMSVRQLDSGHYVSLALSVAVIVFLSFGIFLHVSKQSNQLMGSQRRRVGGFSLWKLSGWMLLKWRSRKKEDEVRYRVMVEFREGHVNEFGDAQMEDKFKECLLLGSEQFRAGINSYHWNWDFRLSGGVHRAREAAYREMPDLSQGGLCLLSRLKMNKSRRLDATMTKSLAFHDALPREWEYIRRALECESLEWYRTNGVVPPDEALVAARLGLLDYMHYVKRITIVKDEDTWGQEDYDGDEVKTMLVVRNTVAEEMNGNNGDEGVEVKVEEEWAEAPALLKETAAGETFDIEWKAGTTEWWTRRSEFDVGGAQIRYFVVEDDREMLV